MEDTMVLVTNGDSRLCLFDRLEELLQSRNHLTNAAVALCGCGLLLFLLITSLVSSVYSVCTSHLA